MSDERQLSPAPDIMLRSVSAGIANAKANSEARAYRGRKPSYSRKQFESAQAMLGNSAGVGEIARSVGLTRQTVYRIKDDPASAEAALVTWGMLNQALLLYHR